MLLIVFVLASLATVGLVDMGRKVMEGLKWRRSLVAVRIRLPQLLLEDQITSWLAMIAPLATHRPIAVEILATHNGVDHYLLMPASLKPQIISQTRASFLGVRIETIPSPRLARQRAKVVAAELRMTHRGQPLTADSAHSSILAILLALQPLSKGEAIHLQWLLKGHASSQFRLSGRVIVASYHRKRAYSLLSRVISSCKVMNNGRNAIIRHPTPDLVALRRHRSRTMPYGRWPIHASTDEVKGLLGFPLSGMHVSGVNRTGARQLPPLKDLSSDGVRVARSNYGGADRTLLRLGVNERLTHVAVTGPTGTGKSVLLANMAVQDIEADRGVVVVDPKGDLVDDILSRLPDKRKSDVVVIDPSVTDGSIGFNPLQFSSGSEHASELTADYVLHVCKQIWHSYWGPRTDDILRSTLMTLLTTKPEGGHHFTLCEVPELLTNPAFRHMIISQASLPGHLANYWRWYEANSPSEQLRMIGPVLSKIRSLTSRKALQLLLGQENGFDLRRGLDSKRVILVPLAKGKIGSESASLIGSLFMTSLWQAALTRIELPAQERTPVFAYVDEFSEVVRLPVELADVMTQARGLGLGLTLACQYLDQLTPPLRSAILGTVRTHIVFQLGQDDARIYEKMFTPHLNATDLSQLAAYELAIRTFSSSGPLTTTGVALPLPPQLRKSSHLASASNRRFGKRRRHIEMTLGSRTRLPFTLGGEEIRAAGDSQIRLL
ncbi:MAG TPA: type IV secretory system conjugative DNA transfer family protein [Candidatus Saccharimonadales bacterium]|nr:type IV secretory system conjugative DNA transfer family protein [Candidatus Saccharimonadales bacterium]